MATSSAWTDRLVPAGLLLLTVIPAVGGGLRLGELAGGAPVTADNVRFFDAPVPVVAHIVAATVYCALGAFQFSGGLRRRWPRWHRATGRVLVPCGLVAALTGLWMTLFYDLPPGDGAVLAAERLFFGLGIAASILLGFAAIRRGDVVRHRAWMTRAYAIGLGAGTQALTIGFWVAAVGPPGVDGRAGAMAAGWLINLAVAEWAIRRRPT